MSVLGQPRVQEEQPHGEPHQGHQGDTPALRIEAVQGNYEENSRLEIVNLKKENQFLRNRFEQTQTSYNELEKELTNVRKSVKEQLVGTFKSLKVHEGC